MEITTSVVVHIAELCKLKLTDEEIQKFTNELGSIVNYVNTIQELSIDDTSLNTNGTSGTSRPGGDRLGDDRLVADPAMAVGSDCLFKTETPLREDIIKEGLSISEVLANAPATYNNYFVVPKLI